MLTLRCLRSKGNDRLAWVVAHPSKTRKGRAPALEVGLARAKLGWATRLFGMLAESRISEADSGIRRNR